MSDAEGSKSNGTTHPTSDQGEPISNGRSSLTGNEEYELSPVSPGDGSPSLSRPGEYAARKMHQAHDKKGREM